MNYVTERFNYLDKITLASFLIQIVDLLNGTMDKKLNQLEKQNEEIIKRLNRIEHLLTQTLLTRKDRDKWNSLINKKKD